MPKPLITERATSAGAARHFPEPGTEALQCLAQLPAALRRAAPPALPALDEGALRAHFAELTAMPRPVWPGAAAAARVAGLAGLSALHPQQPPPTLQGALEILHDVARALATLTGLDRFSLQPPSIAVAERAAVRLAVASFARTQPGRVEVLAPPESPILASARELGLPVRTVARLASGDSDPEALAAAIGEATALVAASWLTPGGRLDRNLAGAGQVAHVHGALFGVDASGLALLAGRARLREAEADIAWLSLGELCPVATGAALGVRSPLTQYLPSPLVSKERSGYGLDDELPGTIGPLALAAARLADALPLYVLLLTLGEAGLRRRAEEAAQGPLAPEGQ
ncbi:MAG TPA: hypothetical protein VNE39_08030 [Planctomycetota bacterium]|nr:hypothetical protein [Planctomycetota bacterium]